MKHIHEKISLRFKIMSLTLGLTFLLGASASLLMNRAIKTGRQSIIETYSTYSNSLQAAIAAQFYERYGDVQAFALNPGLQSNSHEQIVSFLNSYSIMYGIYDLIMVVDAKGNLVAVNAKAPNGNDLNVASLYKKNYSDASWFQSAIKGEFTEDKERGYSGTFFEDAHIDPYVSEVFGEKRFGTSFSTQVKDAKGTVIGVITNRAASRWFEGEFVNLYAAMKKAGLGKSELTMLSKDGTVLVDYDPSLKGRSEIVHDYDVVGKLNLAQAGLDIALDLQKGIEGKMVSVHKRKKTEQATGYSPIVDKKFIPSIGWGVIVRSDAREAFANIDVMERIFYMVFFIISAIGVVASVFFSNSLAKTIKSLADRLGMGAERVLTSSSEVAAASNSLLSSTTEQAAALQETVASVEEVSAMVAKNAENAKRSQDASATNQSAADRGKEVVLEMIQSIEDINQSNSDIMKQIETSNHEIAEIVKVIGDIGEKTKVINDIVFQTKLLSFNASVEAARAGEHGKGFAVVAEEVGNLAQMSGNAAKEITSMLEGSIQKVEGIVSDTKVRVERLVSIGREKVQTGTENAKRCGDVLNEIVQNVTIVNDLVVEIANASQEQAQGVGEITKAMNQIDQVTQMNVDASQKCSTASDELEKQADELKVIVQSLLNTVQGAKDESVSQPAQLAATSNRVFKSAA